MLTTTSGHDRNDSNWNDFDVALKSADFQFCHQVVDGDDTPEGRVRAARLALRERRFLDAIGLLSDFPDEPRWARLARDIILGAALGSTRDYTAGRRLIDRALLDLAAGDELYEEAYYYKSAIAWMQHEHREAQESASVLLASADPNNRARARIVLSWIALRRGDVLHQVDELQQAMNELDSASTPDQYIRANALFTLALLCRELPMPELSMRVRESFEKLPWTPGLQLERFQVTRFLATINELEGNELAAFAGFKAATRLAPSQYWNVLCLLDRAALAKNTGETAFSAEQLNEAHEIARMLSWNDVAGEERSALLVLAELFADENVAVAEQYLALFRSLGESVIPQLSYGSDPRVRGFAAYSQGLTWLRLGDVEQGKITLAQAWEIFDDFNYAWRAALCALRLYEATQDRRWIMRATHKIEPWPRSWIAHQIRDATTTPSVPLQQIPPAKRKVLELVRAGRRNSEIAHILGRSPNTIRNQVAELFATFNVRSRAELVAVLSKQRTAQ